MEEGVKMTAMQLVDVQSAAPASAPRAAYDLPDAPLAMPEQDLRPANALGTARQSWRDLLLRPMRGGSNHGAAQS